MTNDLQSDGYARSAPFRDIKRQKTKKEISRGFIFRIQAKNLQNSYKDSRDIKIKKEGIVSKDRRARKGRKAVNPRNKD